MKASFVFAGNARVTVRWTGTSLPKMEKGLENLFAKYGLEFIGSGYDMVKRERELVFRPKKEMQE